MSVKISGRRFHRRVRLDCFCSAQLHGEGADFEAVVVDVSKKGLCLESIEPEAAKSIQQGGKLRVELQNGGQSYTWTGTVVWKQKEEDCFVWGMRFGKDFSTGENPLRILWAQTEIANQNPVEKQN